MKRRLGFVVLGLLGLLAGSYWVFSESTSGQEPKAAPAPKEVQKVMEELTEAFNKKDAKAFAALWSENGMYNSVLTTERLNGRKAIEADFADYFAKHKKSRLTLDLVSVRTITPEVAVVEGLARVTHAKNAPTVSEFQSILVKKNGVWLIDQVREIELPAITGNEQLKELDFLIGDWSYKKDQTEVNVSGEWVANENFLLRRYTVKVNADIVHEGTQIVGWDPLKKSLRSWTFDSDGAFGEGTWQKQDKRWIIHATSIQSDGKKSTATQILTPQDDKSYGWQVTSRAIDGEILPNIPEVILQRKIDAPKEKE